MCYLLGNPTVPPPSAPPTVMYAPDDFLMIKALSRRGGRGQSGEQQALPWVSELLQSQWLGRPGRTQARRPAPRGSPGSLRVHKERQRGGDVDIPGQTELTGAGARWASGSQGSLSRHSRTCRPWFGPP